ncbi:MAG: CoA transferase, partial [Cellvibrionales bacterium]
MPQGPLAGVKVIELAGIGPGPCAGMMLADMGAEVIVVERKAPNANAAPTSQQMAAQTFYNRGKRSIAVDLKNPEGVELVLKLIEGSDLLIEGFRPGVMERLGLGPEVCHERNPRLVFGRMT